MLLSSGIKHNQSNNAESYCKCYQNNKSGPAYWRDEVCKCGENGEVHDWKWEPPQPSNSSIIVWRDQREVIFHPSYSSGTAVVRGDSPLPHSHHHYWEVKMLSEPYGTDVMIGLGTDKVNNAVSQFKYTSLLGDDEESYGLSYRGYVWHNSRAAYTVQGFCKGTVVGIKLDLWQGTLEFYINRKPQGVVFFNLRRHACLLPMACSTSAQTSMRLVYAASWRASLLVDAARALLSAPHTTQDTPHRLPPGLRRTLQTHFWISLPMQECTEEDKEEEPTENATSISHSHIFLPDVLSSEYMNGFYVDSVSPAHRLVLWE